MFKELLNKVFYPIREILEFFQTKKPGVFKSSGFAYFDELLSGTMKSTKKSCTKSW